MKLAILTGGGDCAGLNSVIRAVVRSAHFDMNEVVGIEEGFFGLYHQKHRKIRFEETSGMLSLGGTVLGTSRQNPLDYSDGIERCLKNFKSLKCQGLIAIGGDGSLQIAHKLASKGLPIVFVPKTIDNDVWGTDYSVGFHSAVEVATEAIDRLHTTAESHKRVILVEVMGRHAGWIATYAGIAAGADAILTPEKAISLDDLIEIIQLRKRREKNYSVFVVSEDAKIYVSQNRLLKVPYSKGEFGEKRLGGIAEALALALRKRAGLEVRVTTLGHIQRGGSPNAFDRVMASRMGYEAYQSVLKKEFAVMMALKGSEVKAIPLAESAGKLKTVSQDWLEFSRIFFA